MNRCRRRFALAVALLALAPLLPAFADTPATSPAAAGLVGTWTVDLRPTPDAPPYLKKLVITSVVGTRVEGSFYDGTPMQSGRVNTTAAPVPCLAFFTDPGDSPYQSSARQVGPDRLEGMTLSVGRGFVMPWTAVRDRDR